MENDQRFSEWLLEQYEETTTTQIITLVNTIENKLKKDIENTEKEEVMRVFTSYSTSYKNKISYTMNRLVEYMESCKSPSSSPTTTQKSTEVVDGSTT